MATIKGKQVAWGMEELEGVMVQSADISMSYDTKDYKGVEGNTESIVSYNAKAEFSINAVCLTTTKRDAVETALSTWCATQSSSLFGLDSGGSVQFGDYKITLATEEAQMLDISCTYYPYTKSS